MSENEKNQYDARQQVLEKRYGDQSSTDPEFSPMYGAVERLRSRYGIDSESWDPEFAPLDTSAARARAEEQRIKDHLAAAGADADRPMQFSVRIANRDVAIQVRQTDDGEFTCQMPVEIGPGHWEWRTLLATTYDNLIGRISRILSAGPTIRDLTKEERLELGLMCAHNPAEAFAWYMEKRCGKESETLLRNPRFLPTYNEGIIFVFAHIAPKFPNTPEAIAYIKSYAAGRPLTLAMCQAAMKSYQEQPQEEQPQQVTEADLDSAPEEELLKSLRALARARVEQDRKKRELVYGKQ